MACAILERTSGLEPSSETTAPRLGDKCHNFPKKLNGLLALKDADGMANSV